MEDKQFDLDLDTLVDSGKLIKLNGKTFTAYSPDLGELLKIIKISKSFQANPDASEEGAIQIVEQIKIVLSKSIPGLENESLTIQQLFRLVEFLAELSVPKDLAELEKKGITMSASQKKILSDSQESSQDSLDSTQDTQPEAS